MNKATKFLLQTIITIMLSIGYSYAEETQDCEDGYFESNGECKTCPDNATCSNNIFTCDENYYKSENTCIACPDNATSQDGDSCKCTDTTQYFLKQLNRCMNCPSYSTCDGSNITGCKDGYFKYNDTCYPCNNATCTKNNDNYYKMKCNPGYYQATYTTCNSCPTGMTSDDTNEIILNGTSQNLENATACYFNGDTTYNTTHFNNNTLTYGSKIEITFNSDK